MKQTVPGGREGRCADSIAWWTLTTAPFLDIVWQQIIPCSSTFFNDFKAMHERINYIVVPDGIAADKNGEPLQIPSFVYRPVLDYALHIARDGDAVYLAPANICGGKSEHELAYTYIMQAKKRNVSVYCPPISFAAYVDTYGNALHLKEFLQGEVSSLSFDLVCAYIHSYRAAYCFRKAGFYIQKVHRVYYRATGENIVRRWWYYKYKPVHYAYELLAFLRDIARIVKPVSG